MGRKKTPEKQDPIAADMGARLAKERKARELSQRELSGLARKIDKKAPGATAIGMYEKGKRRIRHEKAKVFAEIFNKPAAYFLCELSEEETRVIMAMRENAKARE